MTLSIQFARATRIELILGSQPTVNTNVSISPQPFTVPVKVLFKDHLFLDTSNDSDSRSDGGVRHQCNHTHRTATVE